MGIVQLMGVSKGFERIIRKYGSEDCRWSHSSIWGGSFAAEARQKAIKSVFLIELSAQSIQSQSLEWLMDVHCRDSLIQKLQWGSTRVPKVAQHCGNNYCAQNCFNTEWVVTPPKIDFRGNRTDCWRARVIQWKTVLSH